MQLNIGALKVKIFNFIIYYNTLRTRKIVYTIYMTNNIYINEKFGGDNK